MKTTTFHEFTLTETIDHLNRRGFTGHFGINADGLREFDTGVTFSADALRSATASGSRSARTPATWLSSTRLRARPASAEPWSTGAASTRTRRSANSWRAWRSDQPSRLAVVIGRPEHGEPTPPTGRPRHRGRRVSPVRSRLAPGAARWGGLSSSLGGILRAGARFGARRTCGMDLVSRRLPPLTSMPVTSSCTIGRPSKGSLPGVYDKE
jgi:hypothetical protein